MRTKVSMSNAAVQWSERMRRWERSGLTITAFCHREGVSLPSFFQWRKRLQPGSARKGAARAFVPVNIVANTPSPHPASPKGRGEKALGAQFTNMNSLLFSSSRQALARP